MYDRIIYNIIVVTMPAITTGGSAIEDEFFLLWQTMKGSVIEALRQADMRSHFRCVHVYTHMCIYMLYIHVYKFGGRPVIVYEFLISV